MSMATQKPTPETFDKSDLENTFSDEYELHIHGVELTFALEAPGEGQITHLWIDPDLRGQGWGSSLIETVKEMLRESAPESESYYLNIQIQNPGGVDEFLGKMGFTAISERESRQFDNPVLEAYQRFK